MDGNKLYSYSVRVQDIDLGIKFILFFDYGMKLINIMGNYIYQFGGYINLYWGDFNYILFQSGGGVWIQVVGDYVYIVYIGGYEYIMYIGLYGYVVIVDVDGNVEIMVKNIVFNYIVRLV